MTDQSPAPSKHVVDILIEERAEKLMRNPALWFLVRRFLYPVLQYGKAVEMADDIHDLTADGVMTYMIDALRLSVSAHGLEHVPATGSAIVVANHPTGIADGIALHQAITQVRKDVVYFANRDAIRVAPKLADIIIPVEWVETKRRRADSKQTLRAAIEAFHAQKCVVLFPSGRLAQMTPSGLREEPWLPTPVGFARKFDCPITPLHISGRNSKLYYGLGRVSKELKDMTVFHELLNKRGASYELLFGPQIYPADLPGKPDDAIKRLQDFVEIELTAGLTWMAHREPAASTAPA